MRLERTGGSAVAVVVGRHFGGRTCSTAEEQPTSGTRPSAVRTRARARRR
ncbi:hypothetical protein ACFWXO_37090 [Kitasatospora sp. NPDC059088]